MIPYSTFNCKYSTLLKSYRLGYTTVVSHFIETVYRPVRYSRQYAISLRPTLFVWMYGTGCYVCRRSLCVFHYQICYQWNASNSVEKTFSRSRKPASTARTQPYSYLLTRYLHPLGFKFYFIQTVPQRIAHDAYSIVSYCTRRIFYSNLKRFVTVNIGRLTFHRALQCSVLSRGRPHFGFGFGAECGQMGTFGALVSAESSRTTFGALSVSECCSW